MINYKSATIIGILSIIIAVIIGILFQHDIAFLFAGIGIIIIGFAILIYVNRSK